jgi:uncharacterized caspase-like protein
MFRKLIYRWTVVTGLALCLIAASGFTANADLRQEKSNTVVRNLFVVSVGMNYSGREAIQFGAADAGAVAETFRGHAGCFKKADITLLLNENATLDMVVQAFGQVASKATPTDVFVFFFSGHGVSGKDLPAKETDGTVKADEFYLPLQGSIAAGNPRFLMGKFLPASVLRTLCNRIPARQQMVLIDACGSEQEFQAFASRVSDENPLEREIASKSQIAIGLVGQSYEFPELKHGAFTSALLDGLADESILSGRGTREITAHDMEAYLFFHVRTLSGRIGNLMHCRSWVQGADFPIASLPPKAPAPNVKQEEPQARARPVSPPPAPEPPKISKGRDYALLFATNDYEDAGFQALSNPVADARAIGDDLNHRFGFQVEVVKNPTVNEIWQKLIEYKARKYEAGDQLFIFFAGHGEYEPLCDDGFLAARDSLSQGNPSSKRMLQFSNLRNAVDNIPCAHAFLVLDACFSGAFDPLLAQAARRGPADGSSIAVPEQEYIKLKMQYRTRKFLTSGRKESVSDGLPGQHSPFARALMDILRDYSDRGHLLTFRQIVASMVQTKPEPCSGDFGVFDPGSDFVFVPAKR